MCSAQCTKKTEVGEADSVLLFPSTDGILVAARVCVAMLITGWMCAGSSASNSERFDYIVAGAGMAGSMAAARLSPDPSRRVLLVDSGADQTGFRFYWHAVCGSRSWTERGASGETVD